ncbi:uncharacterized protein LOC133930421 [Phragmites australis]|uniref:uncharacterized protein LOC133930421 n=1 Tax=Phragmites australis TaxID=29695 RepID=UPI002D77728E|nr:uncharacterized protein LOC133930421 [Phragmites australis]
MERPQQAAAAAATAEEIIALYDAGWFRRLVLLPPPPPAPTPAPTPQQALPERQREAQSVFSSPVPGLRHRRTRSDEAAAAAFQSLEPLKIPNNGHRARLETIHSGKDGHVAAPQPLPERRRQEVRRPSGSGRRRRRRGWSMSELEFEEIKGLRDLGFTFSDAEVDAELASIVPGLRRKRSEDEARITASAPPAAASASADVQVAVTDATAASAPRRPYLSEAWDDEEEEVRTMLRNWRIPAARDGTDLKEHIRMWAHTVASAVR